MVESRPTRNTLSPKNKTIFYFEFEVWNCQADQASSVILRRRQIEILRSSKFWGRHHPVIWGCFFLYRTSTESCSANFFISEMAFCISGETEGHCPREQKRNSIVFWGFDSFVSEVWERSKLRLHCSNTRKNLTFKSLSSELLHPSCRPGYQIARNVWKPWRIGSWNCPSLG